MEGEFNVGVKDSWPDIKRILYNWGGKGFICVLKRRLVLALSNWELGVHGLKGVDNVVVTTLQLLQYLGRKRQIAFFHLFEVLYSSLNEMVHRSSSSSTRQATSACAYHPRADDSGYPPRSSGKHL